MLRHAVQNQGWCFNHNRRLRTKQITTKLRFNDAILHEIAWRSQRWPARLLLDRQCHTFRKPTLRIVLNIVEGAPKEIYFHTPLRRSQDQPCKQIFWSSRSYPMPEYKFTYKRSWSECPEAPSVFAWNPPLNVNWPGYPRHASTRSSPLVAALQLSSLPKRSKENFVQFTRQYSMNKTKLNPPHEPHDASSASIWHVMREKSHWLTAKLISALRFETSKTVPKIPKLFNVGLHADCLPVFRLMYVHRCTNVTKNQCRSKSRNAAIPGTPLQIPGPKIPVNPEWWQHTPCLQKRFHYGVVAKEKNPENTHSHECKHPLTKHLPSQNEDQKTTISV